MQYFTILQFFSVQRFGELIRKIWNPRNFKAHVSPHEMLQVGAFLNLFFYLAFDEIIEKEKATIAALIVASSHDFDDEEMIRFVGRIT